jgi:hypothetical protein
MAKTRHQQAAKTRKRRLKELRKVVELCNCTWPLDVMRNGDGHADNCPAHKPLVGVDPSPTRVVSVDYALELYDSLPVTMSEPITNEDGFFVGFGVTHPPGIECVFPLPNRQCSCGKTLSDLDATEQPLS